MLFQKSREVLADQSSDIQERHHHYCHADQTKWGLEDNEGIITDIKNARNVKGRYIPDMLTGNCARFHGPNTISGVSSPNGIAAFL